MTTIVVELVEMQCGGCGCWFGLERRYYEERRKDGQGFKCPNGCSRAYKDTEADRLRRQLAATEEQLRVERSTAETVRRSRDVYRGKLNATKARIRHGVCPCCKRTFSNVARHMTTKHPEFAPEAADHG